MSEVNCYMGWDEFGSSAAMVKLSDYDALAAQRDEGLAREAELRDKLAFSDSIVAGQRKSLDTVAEQLANLQQRLAEAEKLLKRVSHSRNYPIGYATQAEVDDFLASPGCADGEKAE